MDQGPIVLFDGVCNLCNASVNFIIDRDPAERFRFGALQSEAAKPLLAEHGLNGEYLDSLVLIEGGQAYRRSEAALRFARRLGGPWKVGFALIVLPRPLRDRLYDGIARNRYRWFGRSATCRIPTPELRARFID